MRRLSLRIAMIVRTRKPLLFAVGIAAACALLSTVGCGSSDLGQVSGTVTLDGAALPEAFVEFVPTGGQGSTSSGRTDRNGNYQLMFSRTESGAWLGTSTVRITTRDVVADDQGRDVWLPEKVPSRYNSASELSVEVKPGSNRFDFDLRSDGTTDES